MERAPGTSTIPAVQDKAEAEDRARMEADQRAASILESMPVAFLAVDREWRLTYANREAERFARRRREDVLGHDLWAEFPEMAGTPLDAQLHRALAERVPVQFEALYPPHGPWLQVRAYPADGGLAVYYQDISERKRMEAEREGLRAEAERRAAELDAVVSSAADAVLIYDAQGRIARTNAEAERLLGYRLTEREQLLRGWMGTRIETVDGKPFPPEDAPLVRVQRGETVRGVPAVIRRPLHAPVWVSVSAAKVHTAGGEDLGVVLTAADVTALHELQEETVRLLEAARRARGEAEAAQARLEAVLEQMPSGVAIAEAPSGRLLLGNEQMARIWGQPFLPLAGVEQYSAYEGFHADGRPYEPEEWPLARSIRTGEEVHDELIDFQRADGSRGTLSVSSAPIRDRDGHVVAAVAVFDDVAERKRAEEALLESEERFRRIFEEGPLGMVLVGLDFRLLAVNARFAQMLGYTRAELTARTFPEITHPDDIAKDVELAQRLQAGEIDRYSMEKRYITKQDNALWARLSVSMIRTPEGKPQYYLSMIEDISQRKRMEDERERLLADLQAANERLSTAGVRLEEAAGEARRHAAELDSIISSIADGLIIYDAQGHIVRQNAEAERLLGYGPAERAQNIPDRMRMAIAATAEGRPLPVEEVPGFRALHGETVRGVTLLVRRPGHEDCWISASAAPIRGHAGEITGAVSSATDITELHQLQEQTARLLGAERQAREQAEAAVRARDDFLAASAHELKTPLTSLRGHAQTTIRRLQREEAPDPERTRRALAIVDRQAERLARLVQQLLDVASIEAGQLQLHRQETDLVPLVRGVVEGIQAGTRRHTLTLQAPPAIQALVDPERIEQVVANLLDNAVKFSPEGTPVEVELAVPEPATVRLSVRDYGPGVAQEQREQLFSRFFQAQTGRAFAGLGLGLYFSRRIVEAHGGRIWAEFPEDGGSRFVVELPAVV